MCEQKFFKCKHCGNFVGLINNAGVPLVCCGEPMEEQVANSVEASLEKHIPEVTINGDVVRVQIGSIKHPMEEAHHIEFIYLQTANGGQRKCLTIGQEPFVEFKLIDDKALEVFAYCNLHGLWKCKIK